MKRHVQPRVQRPIPSWMAHPRRSPVPAPDSVYRDALIVGLAILLLISCWWLATAMPVWPVR